ncbi:MAG: hypothetical protein CL534_05750 [Ahrensia sp.]|jgi:hypothetical protein|nr:hypothetical protein [Ahrensia sp.]
MTREPAEAQAILDLVSDVLCKCQGAVQADVGALSGELFLKVDVEGRTLQFAADALGLTTHEPRTMLFLFWRQMAGALVGSVSGARLPDAIQTRGDGAPRGQLSMPRMGLVVMQRQSRHRRAPARM